MSLLNFTKKDISMMISELHVKTNMSHGRFLHNLSDLEIYNLYVNSYSGTNKSFCMENSINVDNYDIYRGMGKDRNIKAKLISYLSNIQEKTTYGVEKMEDIDPQRVCLNDIVVILDTNQDINEIRKTQWMSYNDRIHFYVLCNSKREIFIKNPRVTIVSIDTEVYPKPLSHFTSLLIPHIRHTKVILVSERNIAYHIKSALVSRGIIASVVDPSQYSLILHLLWKIQFPKDDTSLITELLSVGNIKTSKKIINRYLKRVNEYDLSIMEFERIVYSNRCNISLERDTFYNFDIYPVLYKLKCYIRDNLKITFGDLVIKFLFTGDISYYFGCSCWRDLLKLPEIITYLNITYDYGVLIYNMNEYITEHNTCLKRIFIDSEIDPEIFSNQWNLNIDKFLYWLNDKRREDLPSEYAVSSWYRSQNPGI